MKTQKNVIVEMERDDTKIKKIIFGKEDTFKIIWEDGLVTEYNYQYKRRYKHEK